MFVDWDMRKPSLVSVLSCRYLYDLWQMKGLFCKVPHLVNRGKILPDLLEVVVGINSLKITGCSDSILKAAMWA